MSDPVLIAVNIIGLGLTVITLAVTGTWQLGKHSASHSAKLADAAAKLTQTIAQHRESIDDEIAAVRQRVAEDMVVQQRILGETLAAVREKVNAVELEAYKTFVRRESYLEMMRQAAEAANQRFDKLEMATNARFDKMESATTAHFYNLDQKLEQLRMHRLPPAE